MNGMKNKRKEVVGESPGRGRLIELKARLLCEGANVDDAAKEPCKEYQSALCNDSVYFP